MPQSSSAPAKGPKSAKTPTKVPYFKPKSNETASLQLRFRQLREYLGWSLEEMATELTGSEATVTERDVRDWESAARRPSAAQFEALARVTHVDLVWLKTGQAPAARG